MATSSELGSRASGVVANTFRAFGYRNFRLLWGGAFTSTTGTWLQEVAQSWLVYTLTGSTVLLGLTAFLAGAPILLFSLIGGVVADRMDRRKLLLLSQYTQMSSAFILAALIFTGRVEIWHILVLTFVNGTAQAFGGPAYQALIPSLVEPQHVPNAIALMTIQFNLARVVGPVIAGLTMKWVGAAACFALNGLSFMAVILSLWMLHVRFVPKKSEENILTSLREGLRFVYHHGSMLSLIVLAFCCTGLGIPLITFLPTFAKDVFGMEAQGYATMLAFSGAGSVLGALVVAWMGHIQRKGRVTLLMLVAMGVLGAAFARSSVYALSCALLFLGGGAVISVFAMISSLVQFLAPEELRGRILSVYNVAFRGGMPLGNLATGFLARAFSPQAALFGNGVALALVGVYFLVGRREVRQL
jgi:predicted MFS family arabinose efflux permease